MHMVIKTISAEKDKLCNFKNEIWLMKDTSKPVATPPNAVVFSYEHMLIQDMMKAELWLNLITIGLIYLAMQLLAPWMFGL